jgi:hypothetical protein
MVNVTPLLTPFTFVTATFPVLACAGTKVPILESFQLEIVALTPLNVTVPAVDPKWVPAIVTGVPAFPDVTDRVLIVGGGGTGTVISESVTPPGAPLNCTLAVRLPPPVGAFVTFTPTHKKKRSVLLRLIAAVVEHENVYRVAALVIAVVPVPTQNRAPAVLFK